MKTSWSFLFAWLANLLMPGLGHVCYREFAFGLFIYLITLMGSILFVASFFVDLPPWGLWLLLGLPLLFYVFTFVDLTRTVRRSFSKRAVSVRRVTVVLIVGLAYQLFSPTTVTNFLWRNRPTVLRLHSAHLSPLFSPGDVLFVNPMAYKLEVVILDRPVLHRLPGRFELVQVEGRTESRFIGAVLGLPGEMVEVVNGVVAIDGHFLVEASALGVPLRGDCPLTVVDDYSILVATFRLGRIDRVEQVPLDRLAGRISGLL
ncbi:MAG: S26 family signal peptidase [bacterium]